MLDSDFLWNSPLFYTQMDYKKTLNLPKTDFPMKANLIQREPLQIKKWEEENLYGALLESKKDRPAYILHDGPPYANGRIHIGHALNKVLKDFVIKSKSMEGYRAPFVPGWDCHGLPIEHQVLKNLGSKKADKSHLEIRQLCRDYARKFIDLQKVEFKRLGILGDWENPYLTMTPDYEAAIIREFGKVVRTGAVYRAKKPVLWCSNDGTALAEAEVEYEDHSSPSIFVKFRITGFGPPENTSSGDPVFILIWTTTPWTLPANQGVALHPGEIYKRVRVTREGKTETWILAEKRLKSSMDKFGLAENTDYQVEEEGLSGTDICAWVTAYRHPFIKNRIGKILEADFVTMDQGTGCVHIAPGHGQEDYDLYRALGSDKGPLKVVAPVDNRGRFTEEAGVSELVGKKVFDANETIIRILEDSGSLIKNETIEHSYPHCWRCKKPVIFRATEQWFISMEAGDLRRRALDAINKTITWIPQWGHDRIYGMVEKRPDWCISRQRVWGVPIVAFACKKCDAVLCTGELVDHVAGLVEREGGCDIWFSRSAASLLPPNASCAQCGGKTFEKLNDILDVWFESGVSHAAVLKTREELSWPADLYLEGSDQHRGWFHSSLLTSLLTDNEAPYKAVLTHGFVVDGSGKKMSKSAGNVVAPQEVIQQSGAEILRLWIAATDFRVDIRGSKEILAHMGEAYRKIRNTCRFLLSNLYDYDPEENRVSNDTLLKMDRWILGRLQKLTRKVRRSYEGHEFHTVFHSINNFCAVDLSAIYLDIVKDRLYADGTDSDSRRAAQRTLFEVLSNLTRLMAPILSFTAEELWNHLPGKGQKETSVHLAAFPDPDSELSDDALEAQWQFILSAREEVAKAMETKRNEKIIGASQDAKIRIFAEGTLYDELKKYEQDLVSIFMVSGLILEKFNPGTPPKTDFISQSLPSFAVAVTRSDDPKCRRCWNFRDSVGSTPQKPELCARCAEVV